MARMTEVQKALLDTLTNGVGVKPTPFATLKAISNCKSFDQTFNNLIHRGYFSRMPTNDNSNQWIRTTKK